MKVLSFAFVILFMLAACNQQSGESTDSATTTTTEEAPAAPQTPEVVPAENPPHGQPGHVHEGSEDAATTPSTGTTAKLNPPHGEPGHRCDIAVGAPLPE